VDPVAVAVPFLNLYVGKAVESFAFAAGGLPSEHG
jgi:hypothetical protein